MILQFTNEYRWLSNFAPCKIVLDGYVFSSVEHAYQSCKSDSIEWKNSCIAEVNAGTIKKMSKNIQIRNDWDDIKVKCMIQLCFQKFNQNPYRDLLLNTGQLYIQEGNWWGDKFWGVDLKTGAGENILGHIIMKIRTYLQDESKVIKYSLSVQG